MYRLNDGDGRRVRVPALLEDRPRRTDQVHRFFTVGLLCLKGSAKAGRGSLLVTLNWQFDDPDGGIAHLIVFAQIIDIESPFHGVGFLGV